MARIEVTYLFVDGQTDDRWHLIVRDGETGKVKADIGGVWLWSVVDLDGDGITELVYTPTNEKRPPTYCDLHVGRLDGGALIDVANASECKARADERHSLADGTHNCRRRSPRHSAY